MADPEQIYAEVQQEEQQKGSSPAVIEARAKAARQRALEGSPHPKEPKWWPGAQPQFEGDGAAAEPAETPAAETPAEQPAAEAPAEQPAAQAPAEQPAAETPAEQPAAQAPAEQPAAQTAAAPAATATQAPPQPATQAPPQPAAGTLTEAPPRRVETLGVSHGTPTGNRLRPEDSVASDAQFEAQQAVYERRKLIDDLVSSGVPAVSASETERRGSGFLALLYVIIPLIAVVLLLSGDTGSSGEETAPADGGGGSAPSGDVQVVAQDLVFDTDRIELAASQPQTIGFDNQDTQPHNIAIYEDADAGAAQQGALFDGEEIAGGSSTTYEVDPLDPGRYYFQCDIHPSMAGDVLAEGGGGGGQGGQGGGAGTRTAGTQTAAPGGSRAGPG